MATTSIVLSGTRGIAVVNKSTKPRRVTIKQVEGKRRTYSFRIGPLQVQYEGFGIEYINIDRPGDRALLEGATKKPRTISFEAVIANPDQAGLTSIENDLRILEAIAEEDVDLVFTYGLRSLPYRVRLSQFSYSSARRDTNGNILQAAAQIQLSERPRHVVDPVTLAAIQYTPRPKPPEASSGGTNKATTSSPPRSGGGSTNNSGGVIVRNPLHPPTVPGGGPNRPF